VVSGVTNVTYTVTFTTPFATAPTVMVTALAPEVFPDDGNHYMNVPAVMGHSTSGFTTQFGTTTSSVEDHTYPNAFCFAAMK
jgi:hypothetical protein